MRKPLTSGQKGAQGEKQVARHLRWLSKKQYIVLSDLMLLQGRRLTQIDHVVVSVYGIFVIETKNYHGTITGTERKEFWTQERHGKRYNFRSPFRQNYAHIRALMQLLGLDEDCFFSIAAFADDAVLAVEQEEDSVEQLVHFREVRRTIRRQRQMRQSGHAPGETDAPGTDRQRDRLPELCPAERLVSTLRRKAGAAPRHIRRFLRVQQLSGVPLHPGKRGIRQHRIPQKWECTRPTFYIHLNCVQKKTK